jgi:hypothetical protein
MQKFSEFVAEQALLKESQSKDANAIEFNKIYENRLAELGVKSPLELNENVRKDFFQFMSSITEESLSKKEIFDAMSISEADVKDAKSFSAFATAVLKKAHKGEYDEKIGSKVIEDLIKKNKDEDDGDWGATIGRLTSSLGK